MFILQVISQFFMTNFLIPFPSLPNTKAILLLKNLFFLVMYLREYFAFASSPIDQKLFSFKNCSVLDIFLT